MPTTTNFGWTTPADTDLVSQGAAAMRTLGNGIDTSLVDLKGGSTGQALVKASSTDLDYTWEANGWYQLATSNLTTSTTNLSSIPTTYKDLRIVVTNYMQNVAPTSAFLRVGTGSASSSGYNTTKNPYSGTWTGSTTATDLLGSGFTFTTGTTGDIICDIYNYSSTTDMKMFMSCVQMSTSGQVCLGNWSTSTAINYVSFVAGQTPSTGSITIFGRM